MYAESESDYLLFQVSLKFYVDLLTHFCNLISTDTALDISKNVKNVFSAR